MYDEAELEKARQYSRDAERNIAEPLTARLYDGSWSSIAVLTTEQQKRMEARTDRRLRLELILADKEESETRSTPIQGRDDKGVVTFSPSEILSGDPNSYQAILILIRRS